MKRVIHISQSKTKIARREVGQNALKQKLALGENV